MHLLMKVKEESEKKKNWLKTQHSKNQDHGIQASLMAQQEKNPPAMWETWVQSLGWKDSLEEGMVTYSSILACGTPWTV